MPLADTAAIAFMLGRPPTTIRTWAKRGHLTRRGTGPHRRALYDIDEALTFAATRVTLDNASTCRNTGGQSGPVCPAGPLPCPEVTMAGIGAFVAFVLAWIFHGFHFTANTWIGPVGLLYLGLALLALHLLGVATGVPWRRA